MKKFLKISFLIMLIITLLQINSLYALYKSEYGETVSNNVGAWIIRVDESVITNSESNTYTIPDSYLHYELSDLILDGKVAPGRKGYLDIQIDTSSAAVSVIYELNILLSQITNASIEIESVENYFINGSNEKVKDNENSSLSGTTIKGIISLDNQSYRNLIRIHFIWKNYESYNSSDSKLGTVLNSTIKIPLSGNFKQYIGEGLN